MSIVNVIRFYLRAETDALNLFKKNEDAHSKFQIPNSC